MTTTHTGLTVYREQLRNAIDRDLERRTESRPRRSLVVALPTAGVVAAGVAAALVLTAGTPSGPSPAEAAILRHIATEMFPPAGTILHEQATVSVAGAPAVPYQLWEQADAPHAYRVIKFGHEASVTPTSVAGYDASSNTITVGPAPALSADRQPSRALDFAGTLRSMVQSGQATIDATTTFDGVRAYKLTVAGAPDRFLNGTAYVAVSDYHPLELDTTANGGEVIKFSAYEYLPANPANMSLLSMTAAHPSAHVVSQP